MIMLNAKWLVAGGATIAVVTLLGTLSPRGSEHSTSAVRRECPHDWVWDSIAIAQHQEELYVVSGNQLSAPGVIQNVPEFHDCQRFVVTGEGGVRKFGELFAIFVTYRPGLLDSLVLLEDTDRQTREIIRERTGLTGGEAIPAAEIYAEGDYDPLGIRRYFNCLYLYRRDGQWHAKMVPSRPGHVERDCSQPVDDIDSEAGRALSVQETKVRGFSDPDDYPPVARWGWDRSRRIQLALVDCGNATCEVGPLEGFVTGPSFADLHPAISSLPHGLRRIYSIKGWYDVQFLAVERNATLVPSDSLSWMFPDSLIGSYAHDSDFRNRWRVVAEVMMPQQLTPYVAKFAFDQTAYGGPFNRISLCLASDPGECFTDPASAPPPCVPDASVPAAEIDSRQWFARGTAPNGAHKVMCLNRYVLPNNLDVPGTGRFRWMANDEGGWMRCMQGCCEVLGG